MGRGEERRRKRVWQNLQTLVLLQGACVIISIAAIVDGYHEIAEGYVGVYYKFGALQ